MAAADKKVICKHCGEEFADIRVARMHHLRFGKVKFGDQPLACAESKGASLDACFAEKEVPVRFDHMIKPGQPGSPEHAMKVRELLLQCQLCLLQCSYALFCNSPPLSAHLATKFWGRNYFRMVRYPAIQR